MNGKENKSEKNQKEFEHFRIAKTEKENIVCISIDQLISFERNHYNEIEKFLQLIIRICVCVKHIRE